MQEIKDLKTRDTEILKETIREMAGIKKGHEAWTYEVLIELIGTLPCDTYVIYSKELERWVLTNILDDELVYQEYFSDMNFVIVEHDLWLALARGLHYRFHKKVRP